MSKKLFFQAIIKFISGALLLAALIFIPAGSLSYFGGWLFMGVLFIPMFILGIVMMIKSPELLEKRLNAKEEQSEQKAVLLLSGIMFLAAFIVAGLNYRFGWIVLPVWVNIAAAAVFLFGYALYAEVLRENVYLSRTVEVQENQKVIDTGLYGVVRHPMYMSTLVLFLALPLVLGSVLSLCIMLFYIPIIIMRIKNEEQVLREGLDGYEEYMKKVKYRIIPFIW
ncbi:MAG: isoprenylcysteine carboxylmethyltransferase family protein [Clostridiaceae bacterium]|nr:isoprenylcysteine carboxylmethyltransferase family protein [Clostridiaceae bacterium]